MNNEDTQDKALLYAFGALPEDESEAAERELRADPELRDLALDCQRLVELDARAAPQHGAPFHAYAKIMERIEGDPAASPARSAAAPALAPRAARSKIVPFLSWGGWAAAACAFVALGLTLMQDRAGGPSSEIVVNEMANPRFVPLGEPSPDTSLESRMMELAGLAEAYWFAREGVPADQRLVAESGAEVEQLSGGFTVFDRKFGIGFIAVENLPAETAGKSYHVWAKTPAGARAVRAGALPIGDESRGLFFFDVSSLPELKSLDQVSFFVTEESVEAPVQPQGLVVLSDASSGLRGGARF